MITARGTTARVSERDAQPPVRGAGVLTAIEKLLARVVAWPRGALGDSENPLLNLGALANLMLVVAIVTGILLLFWYVPSHGEAHASVEAMAELPLVAGLLRSLHRYSSDAAFFMALLHGLQMLAQKRIAGPRWLAWLTGIAAVFFVWLVGWLGYWLVWDERAQLVATGTAKGLDVLPIFTDPLGRSFLTDDGVSSLLFFVVFFVHMLLPLLMAVALWLHLSRLARPRWLPSRPLVWWSMGALVVLSLVLPATSADPAAMAVEPRPGTIDGWYLLPLVLTDRLSGGMLWLVFLGSGILFGVIPWALVKRRRTATAEPTKKAPVATVAEDRCNACETCYRDCPYDAISMVPRADQRHFPSVAWVDTDRCVGCGICAGSCDSAAIGPKWLEQPAERRRVDDWLAAEPGVTVVYACAQSAARGLGVDVGTGLAPTLPGCRVVAVPCAGWVHALTVERALRRGAKDVVVVSCRTGSCSYREGAEHTRDRLAGAREPKLRLDHVDPTKVRLLALDPHEERALVKAIVKPLDEKPVATKPTRMRRVAWGLALALGGLAVVYLPSELPYPAPPESPPELVVSFKLAGEIHESCRVRSEAELRELPPHQRVPKVCERRREPVRLMVWADGKLVADEAHDPSGAFGDGAATAVVHVPMPAGEHAVEVALGSSDPLPFRAMHKATFVSGVRRVVAFDKLGGFQWY